MPDDDDAFDPLQRIKDWLDNFYTVEKKDGSGEREFFNADARRLSIEEMKTMREFVNGLETKR